MGIGVGTAMIVGTAVSATASIAGGVMSANAANDAAAQQAAVARQQADAAQQQKQQQIQAATTESLFQSEALDLENQQLTRAQGELDDQVQQERVKTLQEENARRDQLRRTLATQRAQAAAMGFSPSASRDFLAVQDDAKDQAEQDVRNIRLMGDFSINKIRMAQQGNRDAMKQNKLGKRASVVGASNKIQAATTRERNTRIGLRNQVRSVNTRARNTARASLFQGVTGAVQTGAKGALALAQHNTPDTDPLVQFTGGAGGGLGQPLPR